MNYYLGIDGGGTKTKAIVIDENNKIIFTGLSEASALDSVGLDKSLKAINNALKALDKKIKFKSVFIGLGGIQSDDDGLLYINHKLKIKGVDKNTAFYAKNDSYNALASSLVFDEGIALISGTGMNCFGVDKDGNYHFAGGLGYREGDLGSAYSLGFLGMKSLARAIDGRIEYTPYHKELAEKMNIKDSVDIKNFFVKAVNMRTEIAQLALITSKHALDGNIYAKEISELAASELVLCVKAVLSRINLTAKNLTIIGGLGSNPSYFRDCLIQGLKKLDKNLNILDAVVDPAEGAARLGRYYLENNL